MKLGLLGVKILKNLIFFINNHRIMVSFRFLRIKLCIHWKDVILGLDLGRTIILNGVLSILRYCANRMHHLKPILKTIISLIRTLKLMRKSWTFLIMRMILKFWITLTLTNIAILILIKVLWSGFGFLKQMFYTFSLQKGEYLLLVRLNKK